jgi:cytochrome c biogenesis factor
MTRFLVAGGLLVLGALFIATRRRLARFAVRQQNLTWGFNLGDRDTRASEGSLLVMGVLLIVAALLFLTGLLRI